MPGVNNHHQTGSCVRHSALLAPHIRSDDFLLLLGCEVVLDVEAGANLLRRLAVDLTSDGLALRASRYMEL